MNVERRVEVVVSSVFEQIFAFVVRLVDFRIVVIDGEPWLASALLMALEPFMELLVG